VEHSLETYYLTIENALDEVRRLGFDITEDRIRRLAREKRLPFFKEGRRLYIARDELYAHYRRASHASVKEVRNVA
jgi:hypothetical protein